jgi:phosphoenolpyruvate-protein kinase (PTS system EI component)
MEISRKEKFGTKNKAAKKWPKVVLATTFAMSIGTTSVFAAKPELADALYGKILEYTYKTEIDSELNKEKNSLLKNVSATVTSIVSSAKTELEKNKKEIIDAKKGELQTHYTNEIAEITKRKNEAVEKKTAEMQQEATKTTSEIKTDITKEIEQEIKKADINKK